MTLPAPSGRKTDPDPAQELPVSEIFGPTWQGEGATAGQLAAFLRLGRCNLTCRWCDTPYTWDRSRYDLDAELRLMDPENVAADLLAIGAPRLVITGGEPLLHQAALARVITVCRTGGLQVEIETNGTVVPSPSILAGTELFNVSPKLAHSGVSADRRIRPTALRAFAGSGKAVFKFVVETADDLTEIAGLADAFGLDPIWVMPQGQSSVEVLVRMRILADEVLARGWNLSGRLQVLLWEAQRGR